jgi:hypothetical protein
VAGDINLIVDVTDKNNCNLNRLMMGKLRKVLLELELEIELKELYLNGRLYRCSNEREHVTLEKLDGVFSFVEWKTEFPFSFLSAMCSFISDCCPLFLNLAVQLKTGMRFHFEAFWSKVDAFSKTVGDAWSSMPGVKNPFKRLAARLSATTKAVTSWNDSFIESVKLQILVDNEIILSLDVAMEKRDLSLSLLGARFTGGSKKESPRPCLS